MNFPEAPHQGVSFDNSLVGYWNMDEGAGMIIYDFIRNDTNGTVTGANWVDGKYGGGLSFDGVSSFAAIPNSSILDFQTFSVSIWIKIGKINTTQTIIDDGVNSNGQNGWLFRVVSNKPNFILGANSTVGLNNLVGNTVLNVNTWYQFSLVASKTQLLIYVNGVLDSSMNRTVTISYSNSPLTIGNRPMLTSFFSGLIDDLKIYNCSLSAGQVAELYSQPATVSLSNYYNYQDPVTHNTLLIHIDSPNATNNNTTLVTCTSFFVANKLAFQSNSSSTVNVWTNLGKPTFTTGVWNSQNYTTTLTLDSSSTSITDWNPFSSPSASNFSTTSTYAGNTTIFSTYWSDTRSLSGGGYIFSTNNTGQWFNTTWTPFTLNSNWGNATLILNSTIGTTISFGEYANNSLNQWGSLEIYSLTTAVSYASIPAPSPTPTPIPTTTPTPRPTSKPTSTLIPTSMPAATITPTVIASRTNPFPTERILIVASTTLTILSVVFALALKKGYLKIEIIREESVEEF